MSDINLHISIKEENNILFKRCIRKLLDSTFIVGEKDEKLFSFISRESNRQDISDYLRMIGFDVLVDTKVGVAMMKPHESDEDTVGLKRANVVSFTTEQYHLLLVLWEVYLENVGYQEVVMVTKGELIDKIKAYEVSVDKAKLSAAWKLFKKYDLIDFDLKDETEEAVIRLYPSLQFGWDIDQFRTVTAEYVKNGMESGIEVETDLETDANEGSDEEGDEE